jgi:hypothetical protein
MRSASATIRRRKPRLRAVRSSPGVWLAESERLFRDFVELTPRRFRPFVRSFGSWDEYQRWRRAQTNPWYR